METRWIEETTLGAKHKDFKWRYSSEEGIVILRDFKNAKDNETTFTCDEIDQIIEYVIMKKVVMLSNSVSKVEDGTEKEGLGKFSHDELQKSSTDQQATSQLAAIFVKSDIFGWNGAKKNMEFWLKDRDWRSRIEKVYDNHDTFEKLNFTLNHITMSVSNLEKSIDFYRRAFGADILAKGEKLAYFDLNGIWIALNVEIGINRNYAADSYTHIAFGLSESELIKFVNRLDIYSIDYSKGRSRSEHEGSSVYLRDPDGHLLEIHTKSRMDILSYHDNKKDDIEVYGII